jgi:hypothetical protein
MKSEVFLSNRLETGGWGSLVEECEVGRESRACVRRPVKLSGKNRGVHLCLERRERRRGLDRQAGRHPAGLSALRRRRPERSRARSRFAAARVARAARAAALSARSRRRDRRKCVACTKGDKQPNGNRAAQELHGKHLVYNSQPQTPNPRSLTLLDWEQWYENSRVWGTVFRRRAFVCFSTTTHHAK